MNPRAKRDLLTEELADEVLVYDPRGDRAHCLNHTAAFLLEHADGTRDPAGLKALAEKAFGEETSEEAVRLGLERLARAELIDWDGSSPAPSGPSRREAIRRIATASLALPAVMTVARPLAAQGTGITPRECRVNQDIGSCCVNQKYCIYWKGKIRCKGARC
jgi:hypothetical protein